MGSKKIIIADKEKIKNKHQCHIAPDLRRKCPECGKKNFYTSTLYGRIRTVENGETVSNNLIRQDAGSFNCKECGYYETY